MPHIITFGEIMARLAPPGLLRLAQSLPGQLDVTFAGAEANTAVSLALLGSSVEFVTALPENPLADACLAALKAQGVQTSHVRRTPTGRLGIFFVETGANQRPTQVHYDRDYSAISLSAPGDFNWPEILRHASWLHLTGITAALSQSAADLTIEAARTAHALGLSVAFDINFRSKLWRWDHTNNPTQLARNTLRQILPFVSLWFCSEEDFNLLELPLPELDPQLSKAQRFLAATRHIQQLYPNIRLFATTFREQISASHNNWSGLIRDAAADTFAEAPVRNGKVQPWEIRQIVDRVGSGDAFAAGILFGLTQPQPSLQYTIDFATAASCLAHSISGDWNFVSRDEIEALLGGSGSGRVVR
jgi:2-dehydro-3-deoxygluconokinase